MENKVLNLFISKPGNEQFLSVARQSVVIGTRRSLLILENLSQSSILSNNPLQGFPVG
jgi:hypothetical protein